MTVSEQIPKLMRTIFLMISPALLILGGCSSVEFSPTASADARPPYDGRVIVLKVFPSPDTYEVLGVVSATGRALADKEDLLELIVERAAAIGANAVVLQGKGITVQKTSGSTQTKMAATAIFRD